MGFGDERGNIDPKATAAAEALANRMYPPDLQVIPGGDETARRNSYLNTARDGAKILSRLQADGMIDLDEIITKYRTTEAQ